MWQRWDAHLLLQLDRAPPVLGGAPRVEHLLVHGLEQQERQHHVVERVDDHHFLGRDRLERPHKQEHTHAALRVDRQCLTSQKRRGARA